MAYSSFSNLHRFIREVKHLWLIQRAGDTFAPLPSCSALLPTRRQRQITDTEISVICNRGIEDDAFG